MWKDPATTPQCESWLGWNPLLVLYHSYHPDIDPPVRDHSAGRPHNMFPRITQSRGTLNGKIQSKSQPHYVPASPLTNNSTSSSVAKPRKRILSSRLLSAKTERTIAPSPAFYISRMPRLQGERTTNRRDCFLSTEVSPQVGSRRDRLCHSVPAGPVVPVQSPLFIFHLGKEDNPCADVKDAAHDVGSESAGRLHMVFHEFAEIILISLHESHRHLYISRFWVTTPTCRRR